MSALQIILAIVVGAFSSLSFLLAIISTPLLVLFSVFDLTGKHGDELPVYVHLTAFFGIFTLIIMLVNYFEGPDLPQLIEVPGIVGLFLEWFVCIRLLIKHDFR